MNGYGKIQRGQLLFPTRIEPTLHHMDIFQLVSNNKRRCCEFGRYIPIQNGCTVHQVRHVLLKNRQSDNSDNELSTSQQERKIVNCHRDGWEHIQPIWGFENNQDGPQKYLSIKIQYIMSERRIWSEEEDVALSKLVSVFEAKKWSQIAKIMEVDYQFTGRSGKQCRERWHNSLNPAIRYEQWSQDDSNRLLAYHDLYGNKWAKIASLFGNRSDNNVKNHFYSTLRKSFRTINKYVKQCWERASQRPFKDGLLSKLICLRQDAHLGDNPDQILTKSKDVLHKLMAISQYTTEDPPVEMMEVLTEDLMGINKNYKIRRIDKKKRKRVLVESIDENDSIHQEESLEMHSSFVKVLEPQPASSRGFQPFRTAADPYFEVPRLGFLPISNDLGHTPSGLTLFLTNQSGIVFCCPNVNSAVENMSLSQLFYPQVLQNTT